ncbi:MAG: hypothetical protein LQ351_005215 [Letrouitia transgressa]|nr:MAG: hypothetical protein LQ351_005215 [Letrouitia transgressa]
MEPLTLKPRQPVEENIECWDDDGDLQGIDDLQFRNVSTTTIGSANASYHRDSISSRISTKSERESTGGDDQDWQVLLPTDDEASTSNAIASAKTAGIPIPANVPTSALLGGTIKRLGGRRLKKVLVDDWDEDLELPRNGEGGLKLKNPESRDFSDALRHFSSDFAKATSPSKPKTGMSFMERMQSNSKGKPAVPAIDKFRDDDDDFFEDVPTIKVAKNRPPMRTTSFVPPPAKLAKESESIEEDLEFPTDGAPLKLSIRKDGPKTPASQVNDDFDMEWAEGSLGTRFGGTRRDGRSNPSSSIATFSPSSSSCLTAESEDEGLDGLVLPEGPLKFEEVLRKRLENVSPEVPQSAEEKAASKPIAPKEDFFAGLDIGDGDVFDSGKLTLNRNIKHKTTRQTSPKRTATTLTFTNKAQSSQTRIPQPQGQDRTRTRLEPVSESGGPIQSRYTRPQSRMGGHTSHASISGIPTPSTPSSQATGPSTPSRRGLNSKSSRDNLRAGPSNPSQLLKEKRSLPVLSSPFSPPRSQPSFQRPQSRGDFGSRQGIPSRPKTPLDRGESTVANTRRPPVPFLPAGTSHAQSHHISVKSSRNFHRPNSSDSNENQPLTRPLSRLSNAHPRPTTPTGRKDVAPESLAREAASKRTLTKPTRRRAFGDGSELEVFDDLPTSATAESKFIRQPVARGAPKSVQMRSKLGLHPPTPSAVESPLPTPQTPLSPMKQDYTPRFARDTSASRMAREQRIGSVSAALHSTPSLPTVREGGPLTSISTNWKSQVAGRSAPPTHSSRSKRGKGPAQKPQLIKHLGDSINTAKTEKGMHWNPALFRWEGNENALAPFDAPLPPPHQSPSGGGTGSKPAPALIANVGASKGVQVVGGMVFDPQRMCWLKMGPSQQAGGRNARSPDTVEDEDDPFAGMEDLEDSKERKSGGSGMFDGSGQGVGLADEEWPVGEEFDVGPEFVKRQRTEEEKWRRKVEGWVTAGEREGGSDWRWALRGNLTKLLGTRETG